VIIERHFKTVVPMIHFAVTKFEIPPERAFDSIIKGFGHVPVTLTDGEFVLYSVAAGVLDVALVIQTAQLVFQFTHIPSSVHFNNPEISDEEIEAIMQDPATMQAVSDAMDPNVGGIAKRFAKALADAYGLPFDGEAFDKAYDSGSPPRT
jgi:hypothetical protein